MSVGVDGLNVWSGERGLGGALTNPTTLTSRKGNLDTSWSAAPGEGYPVVFRGRRYADAEAAYQAHRTLTDADLDLMVEVLVAKLRQHPPLDAEITRRGGVSFLEACSHFLGRPHAPGQSGYMRRSGWEWTGRGRSSKMIDCLIRAYGVVHCASPLTVDHTVMEQTLAAVQSIVNADGDLLRAVLQKNPALQERLRGLLDIPGGQAEVGSR